MEKVLASIDLGSHTARLLIAKKTGASGTLLPLLRKRAFIRAAQEFRPSKERLIGSKAIDNTLHVLKEFSSDLKAYHVSSIHPVATGVFREAVNGRDILKRIRLETGIDAKPISGNREAMLTGKGMLHALEIGGNPFICFDLGGRSTEFMCGNGKTTQVRSLPLGAVTLTQTYFHGDPPDEEERARLSAHVDRCLNGAHLKQKDGTVLAGTGGTLITLAAMVHDISAEDINPENINGRVMRYVQILSLFEDMKHLSTRERIGYRGLDEGRADIILAGCLVILKIMQYLDSDQLLVSYSDILEGILIDLFEGEGHA